MFISIFQSQAQYLSSGRLRRTKENSRDRKPSKCPRPLTRMSAYGNTEVNTEFEWEFKRGLVQAVVSRAVRLLSMTFFQIFIQSLFNGIRKLSSLHTANFKKLANSYLHVKLVSELNTSLICNMADVVSGTQEELPLVCWSYLC